VAEAVEAGAKPTLPRLYDRAVETIMNAKGRVLPLGGRFSRFVSGLLAAHRAQSRSDVVSLEALAAETFDIGAQNAVTLGSSDGQREGRASVAANRRS
jgi:hypothetical protein